MVWVGPALTPWLAGRIAALAADARCSTLAGCRPGCTLPMRAGGPFEPRARRGRAGPGPPADRAARRHLWLDPDECRRGRAARSPRRWARSTRTDAAAYTANADAFAAEIAGARPVELDAGSRPVRGRPYLVFHDAYQYFEHRFGIPAAGSVALQDGGLARRRPGRGHPRPGAAARASSAPSPSRSSSPGSSPPSSRAARSAPAPSIRSAPR